MHQKPWRRQIDVDSLTFRFDVATNDKCGKEWKTIVVVRYVVLAQCGIKVLRRAPPNELAQAFLNCGSVEFLLGQFLTSALDTALDEAQLHRIHVHMFMLTALGLHHVPAKLSGRLLRRNHNRIVDGSNLVVLQNFLLIVCVTLLVVGTEEFQQLVIFSGDDSD